MNSKFTPTVFALMGGKFDRINLISKVRFSYIDQDVCKINGQQTDTKPLYLAIGMEAMYSISNNVGISLSFDNVSGAMVGINYKIK